MLVVEYEMQGPGFSFEYEVIKYVAMACFAKELNQAIVEKMELARQEIRREGLKPKGGCVVVAFDGLLRGMLAGENYARHLRRKAMGGEDGPENVLAFAQGIVGAINEVISGNPSTKQAAINLYSSSTRPMEMGDVAGQVLSRREAEEMARRLVCEQSLGVLVLSKGENLNGNWGHVMSLIGADGGILRVDGRLSLRRKATEVTLNKAANLLRRGQRRKGLIVEIE